MDEATMRGSMNDSYQADSRFNILWMLDEFKVN